MISGTRIRVIPVKELLSMLQLYANVLCEFVRDLSRYELNVQGLVEHQELVVVGDDRQKLDEVLATCDSLTTLLWMPSTRDRAARLTGLLNEGCLYNELGFQLRVLRETVEDELKHLLILHMPPGQAFHFYAGETLLGDEVIGRFPGLGSDIDEAGKCLGTGRSTAGVFHLMRVLEVGVQEFGQGLGVEFVNEKNWHNILEEADKAIRKLDKSDPRRAVLSELSALLNAVKLAWRNEVMHPKASYSSEEAENVMRATKAFMGKIVEAFPPMEHAPTPPLSLASAVPEVKENT